MKFSTIAFAAGATAAVYKRQDTVFEVTNFSASCIPHSTQCRLLDLVYSVGTVADDCLVSSYDFDVFEPGTMQTTPQHCAAMVSADGIGELPALDNGECEQTSKTFKIIKSFGGLALYVYEPVTPSSNKSGVHQIQTAELEMVVPAENPNGAHQVYKGPTSFPLTPQGM
ncbi:unnamed protein product [Clonostachys byssicola]|uniref:Hypersensitive response-inducing protein n=1 Tax=Clonostachys byssicola TaxID=160290 RepID=A0A9N9UGR2_9HYPO|nr:unnamed protein product [Clonostachys byssicola]